MGEGEIEGWNMRKRDRRKGKVGMWRRRGEGIYQLAYSMGGPGTQVLKSGKMKNNKLNPNHTDLMIHCKTPLRFYGPQFMLNICDCSDGVEWNRGD